MTTTKFSICSQALVMLGANPISSFEDGTVESDTAAELYDEELEFLLCLHDWRFASKEDSLDRETSSSPEAGWDYIYTLPAGWLKTIKITKNDKPVEFDMVDGRIYTNASNDDADLVMEYIYDPGPAKYPPHFRLALRYALAEAFSIPVTADMDMAEKYGKVAERKLRQAKSIDSRQISTSHRRLLRGGRLIGVRS